MLTCNCDNLIGPLVLCGFILFFAYILVHANLSSSYALATIIPILSHLFHQPQHRLYHFDYHLLL
jgi:hypothetical protein